MERVDWGEPKRSPLPLLALVILTTFTAAVTTLLMLTLFAEPLARVLRAIAAL